MFIIFSKGQYLCLAFPLITLFVSTLPARACNCISSSFIYLFSLSLLFASLSPPPTTKGLLRPKKFNNTL
ncbi:unnamed protein product [Tuber melanosporum]|uniref:(Perigord truffle) hypothetical protein n=1 Tax=Tuber melanosporum (strain Mel28) TaxID=656061 RepID=D5GG81_TUBMM|nr:uncharacterized protein GSTUM_00001995001 [Tuber melanosporum]CAZ83524.1 unnamed protein product [Tuber melanosporum]